MNGNILFIDPELSGRLCLTLLHSLWQVSVLAFVVWSVDQIWRNSSVERRYTINVAALMLALLALPMTFLLTDVAEPEVSVNKATVAVAPMLNTNSMSPLNVSTSKQPTQSIKTQTQGSRVTQSRTRKATVTKDVPVINHSSADYSSMWLLLTPWMIGLYALGVALMLVRLVVASFQANRLRVNAVIVTEGPLVEALQSLSRQWSMKVVPALARAERIIVPKVVGIVRPTILMPASALNGLSIDELEMILAHELAHVRRYDMWANLIQRFAETVLFFNPGLWYLSRRVSILREYCCDEMTCRVQSSDQSDFESRVRYATTLLHIAELAKRTTTVDLSALAASGRSPSEIRRRIARLFGEPVCEPLRISRSGVFAMLVIGFAMLLMPLITSSTAQTAFEDVVTDKKSAKKPTQKPTTGPVLDKKTMRTFQLNVVGPDNKPVPHALVEIRMGPAPTAKQILLGEYVRASTYGPFAKTDDAGRLKLEIPRRTKRLNMSIKQPGYGPYWAGWSSSEHPEKIPAEITVQLDKAWTVGGVIVDESGRPIVGVQVSPSVDFKKRPGDNQKLGCSTRITTDEKGQWRFENVPDSKKNVFISVDKSDYRPLRRSLPRSEFEIKGSAKPTAPLVLQTGLTVAGTVTDETGKPIPGALVRTRFMNDFREAKTDQEGKYQLVGCEPKIAQVFVFAKGRATDMQKVRVIRDMAPVDFSMKPGGKIRVRMIDEQGKGIPKWRILLQNWRGAWNIHMDFRPMNEYADENGVWEWNEAPLDMFEADINRPGGMQLSNQPLVAREAEYVFSPPKALVISGRVIDSNTKQPIKKFRVTPGRRFKKSNSLFWDPSGSFESFDGQYQIRINDDEPAHYIRIEADNYEVATSRAVKPNEGNITIDYSLEPAKDIAANILTATGQPAAGAEIAIGVAGSSINIKQGKLRDISTFATRLISDDQGHFRIPPRTDPFQLVILHSAGFAHLKSSAGPIPDQIKLTPWARLEGTFRVGKEIAPHVSLALVNNGIYIYEDNEPKIYTQNEVKTDSNGRFVFDRVFPGKSLVGREIVWMVHTGSTEAISSRNVPVEFVAGKTTTLNLGGKGRRIIGKLVPPADYSGNVLWNLGSLSLEREFKFPDMPKLPLLTNEAKQSNKQYLAWLQEWIKTKEGKVWQATYNWQAAYEKYQQGMSDIPRFTISIAGDGSFQIDDVPAGKYTLKFWSRGSIQAMLKKPLAVSVPVAKAGQTTEPIDLGNLILEK